MYAKHRQNGACPPQGHRRNKIESLQKLFNDVLQGKGVYNYSVVSLGHVTTRMEGS
jgi:hypothetical protein